MKVVKQNNCKRTDVWKNKQTKKKDFLVLCADMGVPYQLSVTRGWDSEKIIF